MNKTASFPVSISAIRAAAELIEGHVVHTPLMAAPRLSEMTGAEVFVKFENMQATGSFKERGAIVKLLSLSQKQRERGVIAMSAGNHAQAVACHAARLGVPATIVMPEDTPFVKVAATETFGARVVLSGETIDESAIRAEEIAGAENFSFIHPYEDPDIIAGQGTVALEMMNDNPELEILVVPIGGGGLISGCAIAAKALKNPVEIIGVEAALYPSMNQALKNEPGECGGATLAEGIAVKQAGHHTRAIARELVSDIILVDEEQIERAIYHFLYAQKTLAEGAGAAPLAAMLADPGRFKGRKTGIVLSGGNIDPRILSSILIRELERENRIITLRVTINDRPGMLGKITTAIGKAGANILQVSHKRMFLDVPAKGASIDFILETKDALHADAIFALLKKEGFDVVRLEGSSRREVLIA